MPPQEALVCEWSAHLNAGTLSRGPRHRSSAAYDLAVRYCCAGMWTSIILASIVGAEEKFAGWNCVKWAQAFHKHTCIKAAETHQRNLRALAHVRDDALDSTPEHLRPLLLQALVLGRAALQACRAHAPH